MASSTPYRGQLKRIAHVRLMPRIRPFIAHRELARDSRPAVAFAHPEFRRFYYGIIEERAVAAEVGCYEIARPSSMLPRDLFEIVAADGVMPLERFAALLASVPTKDRAVEPTPRRAFVAFAPDSNGMVRAVYATHDGGWIINTHPIDSPCPWNSLNSWIVVPEPPMTVFG